MTKHRGICLSVFFSFFRLAAAEERRRKKRKKERKEGRKEKKTEVWSRPCGAQQLGAKAPSPLRARGVAPFPGRYISWSLVAGEIDCEDCVARGHMPANQDCELFHPPPGSASKIGQLRDRFLGPRV